MASDTVVLSAFNDTASERLPVHASVLFCYFGALMLSQPAAYGAMRNAEQYCCTGSTSSGLKQSSLLLTR